MIKYLAGVLTVIAVGVLLIAYGLLTPHAPTAFADDRGIVAVPTTPGAFYGYSSPSVTYPGQPLGVASYSPVPVGQQAAYVMRPAVQTVEDVPVRTRVRSVPRRPASRTVMSRSRRDWKKS